MARQSTIADDGNNEGPPVAAALLTPGQVSEYLGVSAGTLANWRHRGRGPSFLRVGRHVRYRSGDVASWLDSRLCTPGRAPLVQQRRTAGIHASRHLRPASE